MKLTAEQQRKAEANMGLVGKVIADKVHGSRFGSYTREDLFQIGCIGLVQGGRHGQGRLLLHLRLPAHLERDLHRLDPGYPAVRGAARGDAYSGNPRGKRGASLHPGAGRPAGERGDAPRRGW